MTFEATVEQRIDLLRAVCERTSTPVVASGGVTTVDDIRTLAGLTGIGVEGAIIGTALYTGALALEDALVAASEGAVQPEVIKPERKEKEE